MERKTIINAIGFLVMVLAMTTIWYYILSNSGRCLADPLSYAEKRMQEQNEDKIKCICDWEDQIIKFKDGRYVKTAGVGINWSGIPGYNSTE